MGRNLPPRRTFVTRPVRRPALGVQQNRVVTIMGEADYTGSTLTSSVFALTANGSATTTLEATVYRNGVLASGEQVTFTVERIQMNAADSFVSANPSDIDSDGVDTTTITVQAAYLQDGSYIGLPGIPAASVVLAAATTTGNTLVQPATATDQNGVTTGTLKTTDALTSKTVSATIAGLAATDTAVITTDGGYVPPAPGTPFFEEDFVGTTLNNDNGFVWGGLTTGRTAVVSFDGYNALRFRYGADASGGDSSAEMRFALGQDLDEVWVEYYLHVPSGYEHRNDTSTDNNKFFRLWGDDYNASNKMGASLYPTASAGATNANSTWFGDYYLRPNVSLGSYNPTLAFGDSASMLNTWTRVRLHFKHTSADNAADGVIEVSFGSSSASSTTINQTYDASRPHWNNGYFFGWSNSGFLAQTDFHVRNVKFYNTDPSW